MAMASKPFFLFFLLLLLLESCSASSHSQSHRPDLHFGKHGYFKILQVADMHYANGKTSKCLDVLPQQFSTCSDLNTTAFLQKMIDAERPDLIVFTGDNIYGLDTTDPIGSMNAAFGPAISSKIPWAAVLGNHDQESILSRREVMEYIVSMKGTLSQLNPKSPHHIDGFGNYNLQVGGVPGSTYQNKSVLNLYFLDTGDYSPLASVPGYDWIKSTQQYWFETTSRKLKKAYMKSPEPQNTSAPAIAYFHIPLPELSTFYDASHLKDDWGPHIVGGIKQEEISSSKFSSGFLASMVTQQDVKAVFTGHDHINDFCGLAKGGIYLCYGGGFGYHAYGKPGWARRARVSLITLDKTHKGGWGGVKTIETWKRLDDEHLTAIDRKVLWDISKPHDPWQS